MILPTNYPVTQPFGVSTDDTVSGIHNGVDFGCPVGTPVYAPLDGRVYRVFRDHLSMGNAVYYRCDRYWMRFLHLSKLPEIGDYKQGDIIGYSGNTGRSTGAHLHWEVWRTEIAYWLLYSEKSVRANLIDPLTLIT